MARTLASLPAGSRITGYIGLGVIAKYFPAGQVRRALEETNRASVRERDLPAHVVVYYVMALSLHMRSCYREVPRCLLEGVQWLLDPSEAVKAAGKSGISQARGRLGPEPLKRLYEQLVGPIAGQRTKGAWYRQWRLVSLDGSTLDTAGAADNEEMFGRPGASRIYASAADRRHRRDAVVARVIDYRLDRVPGSGPIYRLITTILDQRKAPVKELAALYQERGEIETALDELKTHLRGARIVLRSKTPELVEQEFYGLPMVHFAVRGLMHEAAVRTDEDPGRLSFLHAVRVVERRMVRAAGESIRAASNGR